MASKPIIKQWRSRTKNAVLRFGGISYYSFASITTAVILFATNFALLKMLSPDKMGIWQSALLIQVYGSFVQLGIINGMGRDLPLALGAENRHQAKKIADTAMGWALVLTIAMGLIGVASFFWNQAQGREVAAAYAANWLALALQMYGGFLLGLYRSTDSFRTLAHMLLITACLHIISLPLVYFFGLVGQAVRTVAVSAIAGALTHHFRPMASRPKLDFAVLRSLLIDGFPILALGYLTIQVLTLDRYALVLFGTKADLGLYSLPTYIYAGLAMVPSTLGQYVYPQMSFRLGATGDRQALRGLTIRSFFLAVFVCSLLAVIGGACAFYIVSTRLPAYQSVLPEMIIACVGGSIFAGTIGSNVLNSLKAWRSLGVVLVTGAATFWIAWAALGEASFLWRAALAGALCRVAVTLIGLLLSLKATGPNGQQQRNLGPSCT
jgi:O-antigen/teichoic acid export membrane protein